MSFKQFLKRKKILNPAIHAELVLPGEPLIYSIKCGVGKRRHPATYFRNKKWVSLLKCFFRSFRDGITPMVVVVRFYVSPFKHISISARDLKKENVPAVQSYEICDYLLSFLEMFMYTLIGNYRQFTKIDVSKFYSSNPRTVFQFMKWEEYVQLQSNNTANPAPKGISKNDKARRLVQPDSQGHEQDAGIREEAHRRKWPPEPPFERPPVCDDAPPAPSPFRANYAKKATAKLFTTRAEARRRQPRKVRKRCT